MTRGALLAIVALVCGACVGGAVHGASSEGELRSAVDTTLPDVDAQSYAVTLAIGDVPGKETFRAKVTGSYVATRDLRELPLDFEGNTVDDVKVDGRHAEHTRAAGRLLVLLPETIANGRTFTTEIAYHGDVVQAAGRDKEDLADFGGLMVKQKNSDGRRIFTSLSWPSKARRWLPLRDHPRDAASVSIEATFPKAFTVIANGRRLGVDDNDDGTKTWRYEERTAMPSYAVHLAAYEDWRVDESRAGSGVPVTTYSYASAQAKAKAIYGDVPKVLDFYETTFGPFRWDSLSYLEEPIFEGGMEHASVVSMDESLFTAPAEARNTSFHELAHHWSGNLVRIRTWNDFWLSEGFTEYLTARAVAHVDGDAAGRTVWRRYLRSAIAAEKADPHPLAPPGDEVDVLSIFDDIPYEKGALIVRMLEHMVGTEKMTAFLREWFTRHGLGPAVTTDDFERELSRASGRDLGDFFATMVRHGGHPELRVTFEPRAGETELTIEQLQENGPRGGFHFPFDIDLLDDAGRPTRVTVDLTGRTTKKQVRTSSKGPTKSLVLDPDEAAMALASCGQSGGTCKEGFRCTPQRAGVSMCVPMLEESSPTRRR